MNAPEKLEHWQCHDMTREQLIEELLLRDAIIHLDLLPAKQATPAEIDRAADRAFEEGEDEGYEDGYRVAMDDLKEAMRSEQTQREGELLAKIGEMRRSIDELHRTEAPGPARRVVDHLYWLLNFA